MIYDKWLKIPPISLMVYGTQITIVGGAVGVKIMSNS